ncbi:MAG: diguanylate cyclase [Actinobacteria bacterium]|nr:diguanylate cyclase [Actinomycetota bacterium]
MTEGQAVPVLLRILLIEDDVIASRVTRRRLAHAFPDSETTGAQTLESGQAQLAAAEFDVVVADLGLPDSDGFDTVRGVLSAANETPIVLLTGNVESEIGQAAVRAGVQDYVAKDEASAQILKRVISYAIERRRVETKLRDAANRDSLTGLRSRNRFYEEVAQAISRARRQNSAGALLFIDLDNFKSVNDNHGHASGDALLTLVATRMSAILRGGDSAGRVGGDEFAVLLENVSTSAEATDVANRFAESISLPFDIGEETHSVGASVGVAMFGHTDETVDQLIGRADSAMYAAKRSGGSRAVMAPAEDPSRT